MQSRNSIRWLLFILMTFASATVFADNSPGDADASARAGVILDADVGVSGNVEGAAIQGMTGADAEASGDVNANTGDRPRWSAPITRAREKVRNLFRGRGDSSVSGSAQGEISGSVGAFGPSSGD